MPAPINTFKAAIKTNKPQFGCWTTLSNEISTELVGRAGFDWVCIDGEHSPNGLSEIRRQLMALELTDTPAMVRVPQGEHWMIKQVLDIGAQTIIVPMVESAEQAEMLVRAVNYPPHGNRGVGAVGARATGFSSRADYLSTANEQICLIVQVETKKGLDALDDILKVDGLDGVFIGPSDLSADLGFIGQTEAEPVQKIIGETLFKIKASDKAAGILTFNQELIAQQIKLGVNFIAAGMDALLLRGASLDLLEAIRKL